MIPILENALPNMLSLHTSSFHLTQVKWIFKEYSKAISSHVHRAKKSCKWAELYCIRGGGRQTSVETDDGWKYTEQLDDVRNVSGCCHFRYHQSQFRHNIILYVTGRKISVWWFIIQQGRWTQYSNNISSFFFSAFHQWSFFKPVHFESSSYNISIKQLCSIYNLYNLTGNSPDIHTLIIDSYSFTQMIKVISL